MSELETAQEMAEIAVKQVNVFPLQGDKVNFLLNQLNQIASLPQLTIPKSIVDELDSVFAGIDATELELMTKQWQEGWRWFDYSNVPDVETATVEDFQAWCKKEFAVPVEDNK